jgi:hypothetical protein
MPQAAKTQQVRINKTKAMQQAINLLKPDYLAETDAELFKALLITAYQKKKEEVVYTLTPEEEESLAHGMDDLKHGRSITIDLEKDPEALDRLFESL